MGHDGRDGRPGQKSLGPFRSGTYQASTKAPEAKASGAFVVRASTPRPSTPRPRTPSKSPPGDGAVSTGPSPTPRLGKPHHFRPAMGRPRLPRPALVHSSTAIGPAASIKIPKTARRGAIIALGAAVRSQRGFEPERHRKGFQPPPPPQPVSRNPHKKIPGGQSPRGFSIGGRDR
jgi:hypothetical protein